MALGKLIIKCSTGKELEEKVDEWYEKIMNGEDIVVTYRDRDIFEMFVAKYSDRSIKVVGCDGEEYDISEVDYAVNYIGVDMLRRP